MLSSALSALTRLELINMVAINGAAWEVTDLFLSITGIKHLKVGASGAGVESAHLGCLLRMPSHMLLTIPVRLPCVPYDTLVCMRHTSCNACWQLPTRRYGSADRCAAVVQRYSLVKDAILWRMPTCHAE